MQTASPQNSKKVLLLNILDILRRYTDEDHRLSQKEIVDILRTEYNMTVDRKAVKRNLMNLIDFGYEIEYSEGKYYLICNYDKYDDVSNYRLDRIRELKVLDEPVKPYESLRWASGRPLDLAEYMKKHVYMYSSDDRRAKLRIVRAMVSDVIDMFGTDVTFSDEDEGHVTVAVHANEMSVEQFARSFAPDVIVLEPQALADKLAAGLEQTLAIYRGEIDGA